MKLYSSVETFIATSNRLVHERCREKNCMYYIMLAYTLCILYVDDGIITDTRQKITDNIRA